MKKFFGLVAIAVALLCFNSISLGDYRIGILAKRGAAKCMKKWGAMGKYLTEKTGERCIIIPLKFKAIEPATKDKRIHFLLTNPSIYVRMSDKYGIKAIATLINSRQGQALKQFGGVILTQKDSSINTLADLKGKKFMCVKYSSFGGGQMAWRLLLENGINPKKDFASFVEGKKHDNVVLAVLNGSVDAGTVRTDTLERMQAEGRISMGNFKIIHKINDNFPFVHSTRLYPEWPMAACPWTNSDTVKKVQQALINMPSDSTAAKSAKIIGWCKPLDYTPVIECLKAIGLTLK